MKKEINDAKMLLSKAAYTKQIFYKFKMCDCKSASTSLASNPNYELLDDE